jgi:CRISPR-associated protein Csb2
MAGFSIVVEYLTGYAVATSPSSRESAEWPPHPARLYMALAAAYFETMNQVNDSQAERTALDWLATQAPPDMVIPDHFPRDVRDTYVPVNDQKSVEALVRRSRQPRTFPRVYIGDKPVKFDWNIDPDAAKEHIQSLEGLCHRVTRIGHSSSLVWVRLEWTTGDEPPTLIPDDNSFSERLRIADAGLIDRLENAYNKAEVDAFAELTTLVANSKGAEQKKLKAKLTDRFPKGSPTSLRPVISLWQGYRTQAKTEPPPCSTVFDERIIILRGRDGTRRIFGIESSGMITDALRGAILASFGTESIPSWISGHESNGDKLQSEPHIAFATLAFIGGKFADGRLLGVAMIIPRSVSLAERAKVFSRLLFDQETGGDRTITLKLGKLGTWDLVRDSAISTKVSLRAQTYIDESYSWASVTPIVLDRMPKSDRVKSPESWREEVSEIISASCDNIGLPTPEIIRVEKTPFFRGSLRAMPGQGGFPQLRKDKYQVHAVITFDRRITGPVLLGAGRYRGYGLMRPWRSDVQ